uniref:Uncharacterized protein n=1 Tax=Xenopus tropicalis TaxID=8364 RepID=A0A1B8Y1G4_XENTR
MNNPFNVTFSLLCYMGDCPFNICISVWSLGANVQPLVYKVLIPTFPLSAIHLQHCGKITAPQYY